MADEQQTRYVILAPFAGSYTRGDVVDESDLPGPAAEMVKEKSIRRARAKEAKLTKVPWWDLSESDPQPEPEGSPMKVEYDDEGNQVRIVPKPELFLAPPAGPVSDATPAADTAPAAPAPASEGEGTAASTGKKGK